MEFSQEESPQVKKRRLTISQTLVSSSGADFHFSDRNASFDILASTLEQRFYCHQVELKDKAYHKLPFLADGPGSGKSRFLQELSNSFVSYIKNLKQSVYEKPHCGFVHDKNVSYRKETPTAFDDFKSAISSALFINISFGNDSAYTRKESEMSIQKSLCLRILYPYFAQQYSCFGSFFDSYLNNHISLPRLTLESTLTLIGQDSKCIVLGIDEVNVLHEYSEKRFNELFLMIGCFNCVYSPFFVPVLAGTAIGPMKHVIAICPPLHIPLPLLSFDSCLHILGAKDKKYENQVKTNQSLRQLVSDMGGHCWALEILYEALSNNIIESPNYWKDVIYDVYYSIMERYPMIKLPLYGKAIAYSFLSLCIKERQVISELESPLTFLNLEELGLLKLHRLSNGSIKVKIPFIFIYCFLKSSPDKEYSRFWSHLLISKKLSCQSWEEFNCDYMAFRLSLFSKLGITTTPLSKFLAGAKMNIPADIILKIPSINDIKTRKINFQYPSTNQVESDIGTCVLNAPNAAFDAFVYLETTTGKLLFAQQMKLADTDSESPQKITNALINEEYHKVNNSIARHIPNTDFILLVLGRCEGVFDEKMLPSKCAVVAMNEFQEFYGEAYCQHLNK